MRGKDVNDKDPAPPPKRKNDETGEEKDGASEAKKRKISDTSIDDGEDKKSGKVKPVHKNCFDEN